MAETELEVKEFQIRNAELIERNRKRLDADDLWIKEMLEEESMRVKRLQDEAMLEVRAINLFFEVFLFQLKKF